MTADDYGYDVAAQLDSGPITGSSGSTSYAYSASDDLTADTTAFSSASYSSVGALCWTYSGTSSNACSSPPSGSTKYGTNSEGERSTTTPPSGGVSYTYGWAADTGVLTCRNDAGTTCSTTSPSSTTNVYTYDGDGLRATATIDSTTTGYAWGSLDGNPTLFSNGGWDYLYAAGTTPIEQIAAGPGPTRDLLLSDENGNVRGLVQLSSGTHADELVNYTDYDAYGNPITESGGSAETHGLTATQTSLNANYLATTPWGFGEGITDYTTGLIYLVNRYYDPATGQFLSIDPLVDQTGEAYAYAGGDPVNETDPTGLGGHGGGGNPVAYACHSAFYDASAANCIRAELYQAEGGRGFGPVSPPTVSNQTIDCSGSGVAGSFTWDSPTLFVPGPLPLTIQDDVTYSGSEGAIDVGLHADGSVDVGAGNTTADFSSQGALDGLSAQVPGLNWLSVSSSGDISVTFSAEKELPSDAGKVDVATTATLLTRDIRPPGAIDVAEVAAAAAAPFVVVVIARIAGGLGCQVVGLGPEDPISDVCTGAFAAG